MKNNLKLITILLLASILFATCKQNNEPTYDSSLGSILVRLDNGFPAEAGPVTVVTFPQTEIYQTDDSGGVLIKDIEPGEYQVTAFIDPFGTGAEPGLVKPGEVTLVEINITPGQVPNPRINFISPTNNEIFDVDASISFSATVLDDLDNPEDIALQWTSSVDGLLSTEPASSNGVANISVNLSEGDHIIQISAVDSEGLIGGATVEITVEDLPNSVILNQLEDTGSGIELNWTQNVEPGFANYRIYRSENNSTDFEVIEIINDATVTEYTDTNVSISTVYFYRIGLVLDGGVERQSNVQSLPFEGVSIFIDGQIEKMIVDPNRPFIYAVDRVNNALHFINTDFGALTKTIFVGSSPVDLDISLDGDKLYIANFGSNNINVINLNTQEPDFSFFVDVDADFWDGNPYRIAVMSNNRLAFTSEDQWNSIKIVDATTGVTIAVDGTIYQPNLFTNPEGTVLYAGEYGTTGSQLFRFDVSANTLIEVDESNSGSGWVRSSFITYNGNFIFFRKQKILSSNLQSALGTFPEEIYASNADGSIALGEEQYFDANNFTILGNLPVSSTIMAADPNSDTFYIYNETTSRIVLFVP